MSASPIKSDSHLLETSFGAVRMPVRYRSGVGLQSMFWVPQDAAARQLAPYGLTPAAIRRDRALVGIGFFAYRESDLGPYNEAGLSILAWSGENNNLSTVLLDQLRPARRRRTGWAVLDLPVTSERASVVGRECWGLPKFVTAITVDLTGRRFTGSLLDPDGASICTLTGTVSTGAPSPAPDSVLYTGHKDVLWRTLWTLEGSARLSRGSGLALSVGRSQHPMADRLRSLELGRAHPFIVLVSHDLRAMVHEGVPVEDSFVARSATV
jgi:hypothetical protein